MRDHARERVALSALAGAIVLAALGSPRPAAQEQRPVPPQSPPSPSVDAAPPGGETPVRVFTDEQGRICRVYARDVIIEGEPRTAYATVCRESNGRWVLSR